VALTATVGAAGAWTERAGWCGRGVRAGPGAALEPVGESRGGLRDLPTRKQGKKQLVHAELVRAAEAIMVREGVEGLCATRAARMTTRQVRAYRDRPARQETEYISRSR
jgi:hypothetical protein